MAKEKNEMQSLGGQARAASMTKEERSESAKKAAESRWAIILPKATHDGILKIADQSIVCAVLEDGRRVINQETFLTAIGRAGKAKAGTGSKGIDEVDKLPPFLNAKNLKPFIDEELSKSTKPIVYRTLSGGRAYGYLATLLPAVCRVYIATENAGALSQKQGHIAVACLILNEALEAVAIIALIDEATGYQYERPRLALAEYLAIYINKKLAAWVSTFPPEFYSEVYRLKGWAFNPDSTARTPEVGRITNDLIYSRLAPFVLEELKRITPKNEKGRRKHKFFQRLTPDPGMKDLDTHFKELLAIMKGYDEWKGFYKHANRALPIHPQEPDLFTHMPDGNEPEVIEG